MHKKVEMLSEKNTEVVDLTLQHSTCTVTSKQAASKHLF
jgi:hypothetical protein